MAKCLHRRLAECLDLSVPSANGDRSRRQVTRGSPDQLQVFVVQGCNGSALVVSSRTTANWCRACFEARDWPSIVALADYKVSTSNYIPRTTTAHLLCQGHKAQPGAPRSHMTNSAGSTSAATRLFLPIVILCYACSTQPSTRWKGITTGSTAPSLLGMKASLDHINK
jgi:hypothetical protein